MQYALAPLEGITTYIYRNAHARYFGGIDSYYTPFLASKKMNTKEIREILPENNEAIHLIPQILANKAEDFLAIAGRIADYGYQMVNLNLGCPSGTVTAKKRGAGFLSVPEQLDSFLYEIYEKCPMQISIKTRLGVADLAEWESLLSIYAKYPVSELIIHTRLLQEFYQGATHPEAYCEAARYLSSTGIPLCYNGDITSPAGLAALSQEIASQGASLDAVMIGRGIIRNPGLVSVLQDVAPSSTQPVTREITKERLKDFHNEILENYRQIMSGDLPVLFKMKDLWTYMSRSFTSPDHYLKKIRKANRISEYQIAVDALFREQSLTFS